MSAARGGRRDEALEELANALQVVVLCSRELERALSATPWRGDADLLHAAVMRAISAMDKLRPVTEQ